MKQVVLKLEIYDEKGMKKAMRAVSGPEDIIPWQKGMKKAMAVSGLEGIIPWSIDKKGKKKVMRAVSGLEGLDSISMDMKDKKMTVTGDIDPVELAARLSKVCRTEIVSVGPAKEKVVLKLELYNDMDKKKAMRAVSGLGGRVSISRDTKDRKLKVTGDIDPVKLVGRLRKLCRMEIVSVGPAKEEKKKEEPRKEEPKKKDPKDEMTELIKAYQAHYHEDPTYRELYPPMPVYYLCKSSEEDPNTCVIC